jgi:hypothetical protein
MVSRVTLKMTTNIIRGNINRVLSIYVCVQSLLMSTSYRYHTIYNNILLSEGVLKDVQLYCNNQHSITRVYLDEESFDRHIYWTFLILLGTRL